MKFAMYTSALAITVALAGCSSSSNYTPPADIPSNGGTPTPPTPPVETGPLTKDGTTATYSNGATDQGETLARAGAYRIDTQADPAGLVNNLNSGRTNLATAQAALADLNAIDPNQAGYLQALQAALNNINSALPAGNKVNYTQDKSVLIARFEDKIDGHLTDEVANSWQNLRNARVGGTTTAGGGQQEITLADGTVLQTESFGNKQANEDSAFVSSRTIAAYEEDAQGRIGRVAFLEASGSDYIAGGVGTYEADGDSQFFVKVDDGFFENLTGSSKVTINMATESGNVHAKAGPQKKRMTYASDVTFDPSTGAFTAENGKVVYKTNTGTAGGTGGETLTANNATILGQLHGDMKDQFGADYTGVITAGEDRLEAVGTIIGTQTSSGH